MCTVTYKLYSYICWESVHEYIIHKFWTKHRKVHEINYQHLIPVVVTPFIPIASIMVNNHASISHYMAAI